MVSVTIASGVLLGLFLQEAFRTFVLSMSSSVTPFVFQQFLQEFLQQLLLATFAQAGVTMSRFLDDLDDRLSDQGLRFDDLIALSE